MTPLEALQLGLAGEHAAVYAYGVLGGRAGSSQAALAQRIGEAYLVHRQRRDELVARVTESGSDPVAAEVSYDLPNPASTPGQLAQAAMVLEQSSAAVYADMVGSTSGADRAWALAALVDSAVRQLGFGADAEHFPGLGEL